MKKFLYLTFLAAFFHVYANAQWTSVNIPHLDNSVLNDVEIVDANTIWAATGYGGSLYSNNFIRTTDGGTSWIWDSITEAGTNAQFSSISPVDGNICYAAVYDNNKTNSGLFKTTDGGSTWKKTAGVFSSLSFPDWVHFFDADHGVTLGDADAGGNVEVYTTNDGGTTWARVPDSNFPTPDGTLYSLTNCYAVVGSTIWSQIVSSNGNVYVYRSDDKGIHWTSSTGFSVPGGNFSKLAFSDGLNGLIVGGSNFSPYTFRSTDGGKTWTQAPPSHYYSISAVPGTQFFVCTDQTGSAYTSNLGTNWTPIDGAQHLSDVDFLNTDVGWTGELVLASTPGGADKWTGAVFPVTYISFTAEKTGKSVLINWKTANESNNDYFAVERSKDGNSFSQIGIVKSKGNSSQQQQYSYEDFNYTTGTNYYRLKQVDIDGKFSYSNIISINFETSPVIKIFPNPVKTVLRIEGLIATENSRLSIIDATGKVLQQISTTSDSYTYNLQKLPPGIYYVKIDSEKKVTTLKFVKE